MEKKEGMAPCKCWAREKEVRLVKLCFRSSLLINCRCHTFHFSSLLCCYILKVFIVANVDKIPRTSKNVG